MKTRLTTHISAALFIFVSFFSSQSFANIYYQEFLARSQQGLFNTSIMTYQTGAPITMMGMPATPINVDVSSVFGLTDFKLELPNLTNYYALKQKVFENSVGGKTWIGDVVYYDPFSFNSGIKGRAYFVKSESGINGTIYAGAKVLQIYTNGSGEQVVVEADDFILDREGEITHGPEGGDVAGAPLVAGHRDGPSPATLSTPYTIDVLWVTTQLARDSGADINALIELAMATGNDVLENSNVPAQLRVVGIHNNTSYVENEDDMGATLNALRGTTDGNLDEVHNIRANLGADMVSLVSGARNYCGIAYLYSSYSTAFNVTAQNCMSSYTPIHEMGHNFGAHHDKANGNGNNRTHVFGHGYFNNSIDPYFRTVMSYSCPGGGCPRIAHFSDSQQSYEGLPIGNAEEYDNARLMRLRAGEMSGISPRLTSTCIEHTATNSTHVNEGRAYSQTELWTTRYYAVGSDEQISGYSFSTTTLAEEPTGFFTPGNCGADSGETQFGPEVQSLNPSLASGGLRLTGKVFDGNGDAVSAVRVRETGSAQWSSAEINSSFFEVVAPVTVNNNNVTVDIQTEDENGDTFEFSTTFDVDPGEPPVIEITYSNVFDATARIQVSARDPDNRPTEAYYQVDGTGDPAQGTWTLHSEEVNYNNHTFQVLVPNLSEGEHTIHVYVLDETGNISNVESVDVTVLPPESPYCNFTGIAPAATTDQGLVEIAAIFSDANYGRVDLEYRVNSGAWTLWTTYDMNPQRNASFFRLPDAYAENTSLSIDMRATDSSGLQTDCGTHTHQVTYPTINEAPSCEIVEIFQEDSVLKFYMMSRDPNGDVNRMFGKTAAMTEWLQTWPGVITLHWVPNPGFGPQTVQGRVLDYTENLEGLCDATYTVIDTGDTPEIDYAHGYYDRELHQVSLEATIFDDDGDVTSVEFREVGSPTWIAAAKNGTDYFGRVWMLDPGLLAEGDYSYEVRATDSGGRVTAPYSFDFNVEYEFSPTLDSLSYSLTARNMTVSGTKSDPNDNARYVWYKLDDQEWESFWESNTAFSFFLRDLTDGPHTIEVFVEDTYSNRSESQFINFEIDPGLSPVINDVSYEILSDRVVFTVTATDEDSNSLSAYRQFDDGLSYGLDNGTTTWVFEWTEPAVGPHTASFFVLDEFFNRSETVTVNFEIVDTTPCFEDTNDNHVNAGRASTRLEGQTCWGSLCWGGTTTYFANGSDANLGTNGSAVTSLLETSPGYYEVGACNDSIPPVITLAGENPLTIYQGQNFVEPGYSATDNIDGDITSNVVVTGSVDTNSVGSYQLTYSVNDSSGNSAQNVTRTVNVISDDVKPVITIPTGTSYAVTVGSSFANPAVTATDNVDGDISANIVVTGSVDTTTVGTYYLYYNVSDAAGNAADEVIVTVEVAEETDTTPPVITLVGNTAITINVGDAYSEPGYSAVDNVDGDITANVVVGGDVVDPNTAGTYVITYNVSDAAGNPAQEVTRTVVVEPEGGSCFSSTISEHVTAGRAYEQYYSYYATGTAAYLGSTFLDSDKVISLEETSPGNWNSVTSCN